MLAELVGRSTTLPVLEAADGEPVRPGHVYVIPPDATLTIADGTLQVTRPAPPRQHRWPIDTFFMSLAEDQGDCAVSIVLSGTGSDGARGLRAIKEHGGLTLAQAGFDHVAMSGMPASAAATGLVDDVLPVEQMPARLLAHQQHLRVAREQAGTDGIRHDVPNHLQEIARLLHADSGHDFSQYKEKTLVRRIQRRMQVLQATTVPDYIQHLRAQPAELEHLFRELLISVTEFFRDPAAFELLAERVIPALLAGKHAADTLRVWVPGCATGEEAYSIAIALKEAMGPDPGHGQPKVQIFATDIDDRALAFARAGRFRGPVPGVSPERLERWFQQQGDDYVVAKSIRELCIFSQHSAIKDPPFTRLDLVSCRNLLIYMNAELQERLVRVFHYALSPGGYLLLGPSESLSRNARLFAVVDKKHRLYLRREDVSGRLPALSAHYGPNPGFAAAARVATTARPRAEDLIERNSRRVLERHSPAYVVIDSQHDVLRFSGDTGRYLQPTSGAASLNLFALLHKGLRASARSAVQQAFAQHRTVLQDGLSLKIDGLSRSLQLIVEPLPESDGGGQLCVVAFRERETPPTTSADGSADNGRAQQLEQELDSARWQLQTAIDQQETANEDLKSANEEFQSVNEELQSSNEELETSKEEMQSINEELQIVNAELHSKNGALLRANSDLQNLMESTQIATLFLDTQLRVTGFTPVITALFHLRPSDIGRPITEISSRIPYPDLEHDVREVSRSLSVVERLLQGHANGPIFMARMRPYRTVENVIDGVVLTFTDITERRRHELERGQLAAIIDSSKDMIIGHALDGVITSWNASAVATLGWSPDKVIGKSLSLLLPKESSLFSELLQTCANAKPAEFETIWWTSDGGQVQVAVSCSPVHDAAGAVIAGSLIARDIGERLRSEQVIQASQRRLGQLIENTTAGVAEVAPDGHFVLVNPAFCEIVGRSAKDLHGLRMQDITHPEDLPASEQAVQTLLAGGPAVQLEERYLRPDGSVVWVINNVSAVVGSETPHVLAVVQDISERRRAAQHRELLLGELNHRVKNTLASVQSIALQTLANAASPQAFKDSFLSRLQALSNTHNLLAEDAWNGVGLHQVVLSELAPYQRDGQARVDCSGADMQLTPKAALALSMALHELTTNAVKYGALSVPQGRVGVHCEVQQRDDAAWLHLQWRETGGPVVAPPARRGFGSRLIAEGLGYELDGQVSLLFESTGVVCDIDVPLSEVASTA